MLKRIGRSMFFVSIAISIYGFVFELIPNMNDYLHGKYAFGDDLKYVYSDIAAICIILLIGIIARYILANELPFSNINLRKDDSR